MSKKQESLRAELQKVLSRGGRSVVSKSSDGKAVPVPEEAEVFEFDFTKDGDSYGKVFVSVDGLHQLIVYFDNKVANSPKNGSADSESWEQLVRTLKRFAMMKQLSFKLADIDNLENDMAKREHTKRQEKMYEGYHAQGKKASYSDNVPTTKMIIKHKRNMEEGEQRFRQIDKIFIESSIGERALAPTDKPGLARVFARHIAEGGKANDERWNHIGSLCEEYQKMAGFVRATRNGQFNESAQKLVTEGINHYQKLRESLGKMSGKRGYNSYFESYTPSLMEDEESIDLSEMFMSNSLDPRIEGVMPILSKLSKNISETSDMAETVALEEWADNIIGECPETTPTKTKLSNKEVAKRMHSILSKGKEQGVAEGVSLKQKHEDKKRADQNQVRYGKMTQAEFDKKWTRTERPKPADKQQGVAEGLMNKIASKVMGAAPEQPKYKVGQRVKYETSPHQPDWKDGGSGVGVITAYKNGHYMVNGNPVNHFEIKGVVEQGVAEAESQKTFTVVYYSPTTDRNITKNIKADSESDVWDKLRLKNIEVVSVKEQGVSEAKQQQTYKVYIQDTDGSERLGSTFVAKSPAHARELAKKQGLKNITSVELQQGVAEDLDPAQQSAGQFSPKDAYAKPGSLVGTTESSDPLDRIKQIMNHRR